MANTARVTQAAIEILDTPLTSVNARVTQIAVEMLVVPGTAAANAANPIIDANALQFLQFGGPWCLDPKERCTTRYTCHMISTIKSIIHTWPKKLR